MTRVCLHQHEREQRAFRLGSKACTYGCAIGFAASYGVLVLAQAALVIAPGRPLRLACSRALGLTIPAGALAAGVTIAQLGQGADFLTAFAAVATPLLAAGAGWMRGWRLPWLPALSVPPLYAVAWLRPDAWSSDLAGVALIAGACLAVTGLAASIAPRSWLIGGLVLLVLLDVILVWGDRQVEPTMNALQSAAPPTIGRPLPKLQQVDFGSATMGWLDFAAPALLGLLVQRRVAAGVVTGLAAGFWGLLLLATSPIAATPPVLAGLIVGRKLRGRLPTRSRPPSSTPFGGARATRPSKAEHHA
jgi:hypothetical protein